MEEEVLKSARPWYENAVLISSFGRDLVLFSMDYFFTLCADRLFLERHARGASLRGSMKA